MTFDEFKIRVNDFKMKLEYTNENTLTKDLFELNNLIESIKDEPFYNPRCGSAIKNEIKDMDSYEYGINGKMSKSEKERRLYKMKDRIKVELSMMTLYKNK